MASLRDQLNEIERLIQGTRRALRFLSPVSATCLASLARRGTQLDVQFLSDVHSYAVTIGLLAIRNGEEPPRKPAPGNNYSPLVELLRHTEVDLANQVINELIRRQLAEYPNVATQACQIVGELHDNVPAHAGGTGFSMAQFYPASFSRTYPPTRKPSSGAWSKGTRRPATLTNGRSACRRTSFTIPMEIGRQRGSRKTTTPALVCGNLSRSSERRGGSLAVWSGDARFVMEAGINRFEPALCWQGAAITLQLPIAANAALAGQSDLRKLESLAERLNL